MDIRTVQASASAVIQYDASGKRQVHQKICDCQIKSINSRCDLGLSTETKNIQGQAVESHTYNKDNSVNDYQSNSQAIKVIVKTLIQMGQYV